MNQRTARIVVPTFLALSLALAGCSTGADAPSPDASETSSSDVATTFADADVAFAQGMVPHHEQAVEMADTILAKDDIDPRVLELAEAIKAAQQPEIDELNGMLQSWGESPAGGGMGNGGMDGMMSDEDMAALDAAEGTEASRLFLEQMIVHHEGAVMMAEDEIQAGQNPDAVTMAEAIVEAQTGEIATMRDILASL